MFIVDREAKTTAGFSIFYSRRYDGPYYRWSYEQKVQQWRSARVHATQVQELTLSVSRWKNVPRSLKKSLAEHYME